MEHCHEETNVFRESADSTLINHCMTLLRIGEGETIEVGIIALHQLITI